MLFCRNIFSSQYLLLVAPVEFGPTWRNGRRGVDGVSKSLDRFSMEENLLPLMSRYRAWFCPSKASYHFPITWSVRDVAIGYLTFLDLTTHGF